MTTITINVPDLSGAADVDVIEVMVKPGDVIAEGDSLIAVETDKASMEVPAPQGGTVVEVLMSEGATCSEGDAILTLSAEAVAAEPVAEAAPAPAAAPETPKAAAVAPVSSAEEQVKVPDLSGASDVDVIEVMVKAGDTISEGDSLIAVETDKASMEVPSPQSGTVIAVTMKEGDTCSEGDLILTIAVAGAAAPAADAAPAPVVAPAPAAAPVEQAAATPAQKAIEEIKVPDLSGASDVDVIEVMVKAGDSVAEGDSLIAVETDKASMEVPAPKAGVVVAVSMSEGSTCNEGDLILTLET
ncbi:MAG: biotin/lipoyl-containing protein, partial [Pseudomonadales bacterium]